MPRPRTPRARAEVSGRAAHDPQRFRHRFSPKGARPIGEPYAAMTDAQRACWAEMVGDMPWLHSAHRVLLRLACYHAARLDTDPEFGVSATQALSSVLSKLGATPVDECRVAAAGDDDEDPAEQYFTRTH